MVSSYFSFGPGKVNGHSKAIPSDIAPPSSAGITAVGTPPEKDNKTKAMDSPEAKVVDESQRLSVFPNDQRSSQREKEGQPLPLPVTTPKRARIDSTNKPGGLKVHWARFIRRMNGPGTGSNVSESLLEYADTTDTSGSQRRSRQGATPKDQEDEDKEPVEVEQVVVDNVLMHSGQPGSITHSEHHTNPEADPTRTEHTESHTQTTSHEETFWEKIWILTFLRWRLIPAVREFFFLRYMDPATESHFCKESWYHNKNLALWGSAFMMINWALTVGVIPRPLVLPDAIFYYGIVVPFVFVLPFMIIYDFPRKRRAIYQTVLCFQTWMYAWYSITLINVCGYYPDTRSLLDCHGKDFVALFYSLVGLPAIALLTLRQNRISGFLGALTAFILQLALVVPVNSKWYRNILVFVAFHLFMLYANYKRETSERRLFSLRDQLKIQFTATQKAQVAERKAADSKRRLTSYIFHEVRVPLNTALLAVQNMDATGMFGATNEHDIEFTALEGSLMLNDVLDFNRLDAGKFESVSKPYNFHNVLRSMLGPLSLAATARGLTLETELDESINLVAAKCYYTAKGLSPQEVKEKLMSEGTGVMAYVLGDEVRLRQVITNLTSNATKFTHEGGRVKVVTKLLWPKLPTGRPTTDGENISSRNTSKPQTPNEKFAGAQDCGLSERIASTPINENGAQPNEPPGGDPLAVTEDRLHAHDLAAAKFESIVVRIEVHDTGVGIKSKDLVDQKLFSPYVQTDIGRFQGGKGTGLGLALIRRIVKLSGGRLGVKSKVGVGSTFWVELSLGVGKGIVEEELRTGSLGSNSTGLADFITDNIHDTHQSYAYRVGTPAARQTISSLPQTPAASIDLGPGTGTVENDGHLSFTAESVDELKRVIDRRDPLTLRAPPLRARQASVSPLTSDEGHTNTAAVNTTTTAVSSVPSPTTCQCACTARPVSLPPPIPSDTALPSNDFRASDAAETPAPTTANTTTNTTPAINSDNSIATTVATLFSSIPVTPPSATEKPVRPQSLTGSQAHQTSTTSATSSSSQWVAPEKPLRCLVVDDDHLTRKLMSRLLQRVGCLVDTAANGQSAVEMIVAAGEAMASPIGYDVVFLDNQMPVMTGLEAVAQLRDAGRQDFVVGVTGNALVSDQDEYLAAGVNHILTKPVLERSLKAMLTIADQQRTQRLLNGQAGKAD